MCLKNQKVKDFSPLTDSKHKMRKRNPKKFKDLRINTRRYEKSALPYMITLLNTNEEIKRKIPQAPHRHLSAESTSNISPNPSEVISKVSEP